MSDTSVRRAFIGFLVCMTMLAASFPVAADDLQIPVTVARVRPRIMIAVYDPENGHRLVEVSPEGEIAWQHKTPGTCVQFQVLKNGNIVYGYGGKPTGIREINRDEKEIWSYTSNCPETLCFERLADGNTLVVETSPCQVVEVTPEGKILKTLPLSTSDTNFHTQIRRIQRLPNGNILAALSGEEVAREFRPDGTAAWEFGKCHWLFQALRLPSGNTLISCGPEHRVIEVDPQGKVVWELKPEDVPEVGMFWTTSIEVLANGNILIANFLVGRKEPGAHCFEVTREKKVVWQFANRKMVKAVVQVSVLDSK